MVADPAGSSAAALAIVYQVAGATITYLVQTQVAMAVAAAGEICPS
ncbi:hypothetical protein [Occultella aeris]|nr:hypothetical protein [Occultella aeris]